MTTDPASQEEAPEDLTTVHLRQAIQGDQESSGWLVEHLTPALLLQARYRLPDQVRRYYEPDDLIQDVWAIVLPRLPNLQPRDGRLTPVLLKYLSTTLLNRANRVVRNYLRGKRFRSQAATESDPGATRGLPQIPEEVTGILTRLGKREMQVQLQEYLENLEPKDREILVLRGIEQISNQLVGKTLGLKPAAVSMRYKRALERLRAAFPESVFAELRWE